MTTQEMACRELVELVTDYLEGAMAVPDRERFEAHLAECPYCVLYLEEMRATIRSVGALREDAVSEDAWRGLLDVFGRWKAESG